MKNSNRARAAMAARKVAQFVALLAVALLISGLDSIVDRLASL